MESILLNTNTYQDLDKNVNTDDIGDILTTISSRWKVMILYNISIGQNQYTKLKANFPTATSHILTKRLKELEREKFITLEGGSTADAFVVNYSLTTKSRALMQIIKQLQQWGTNWQD